MRTIGKLFIGDVRRLTSNIVSIIIVIGLTVIPGLFTWFNIAASWDPFSNMKNLKFAVASVDEGYRSDLIPMKITMGDQILNTLRANSELDWTFTDEQDAIKGTKSGKYYAAIVIPKSFSKSMMTFFSSNAKNVRIRYYTNEKTNALTPNLTNQGANEVSTQINQMFVKTLTGTALSIASQLSDDLSSPKATAALNNFTTNIGTLATTMQDSSNTIGDFSALTTSASTLLNSSSALLKNISATGASAGDQLKSAKKGATDLTGALDTSTNALATALKQSASSYDAVADSVDSLVASAGTQMTDTAQLLNTEAKHVSDQAEQYHPVAAGNGDHHAGQSRDIPEERGRRRDLEEGQRRRAKQADQGLRRRSEAGRQRRFHRLLHEHQTDALPDLHIRGQRGRRTEHRRGHAENRGGRRGRYQHESDHQP